MVGRMARRSGSKGSAGIVGNPAVAAAALGHSLSPCALLEARISLRDPKDAPISIYADLFAYVLFECL